MNIITFDIEEWALLKSEGQKAAEKIGEYDKYLNHILNVLDSKGSKATFFCTGMMAIKYPQVIKLIQDRGHDIGCHSHRHTWMNKMSISEAREDTHSAVDAIEQCIGHKVLSYRAPAFSIGKKNKWMFEVLSENGIEIDASIFPSARDFGGFPDFGQQIPCVLHHNGIKLKEFPIPITKLLGKQVAYSGGGYFRLFPLWFIKAQMKKSDYSMCYFHIDDLLPESHGVMSRESYEAYFKEPGTVKARYMRYLKHNIGKKESLYKLDKLINQVDFYNLDEADNLIDWEKAPVVELAD